MRSWVLHGTERLQGAIRVPGDKSISHRSLLLGAMAHGTTEVRGFLRSEDCLATLHALRALGTEIVEPPEGCVRILGQGPEALREPETILDAGNSGTSLRLLAGLLAGRPFFSILTGDASLRRRPMRRVVDPLAAMGATLLGRAAGQFPPLAIRGGRLSGIAWKTPVASAQVKSAILLAGLQALGETSVTEPTLSRDHTERMLTAFGVVPQRRGTTVSVPGKARLAAASLSIPGDLSSAAFFIVAAAARPGAEVILRDVGVNPTRTGALEVLAAMGATITQERERSEGGEPVADIHVRGTHLRGTTIGPDLIPRLLDEIPALAVAAALAEGETVISGAAELRVKEVDRLSALAGELAKLGVQVVEERDSLRIVGGRRLRRAVVSSRGDHRMAMSLAVAGLFSEGETRIQDVACVETSFPGFARLLLEVAPGCDIREVGD
ncbi:MAG: 3-phosphoshikimate 1-carboxyvinyltransferase [candidate division NC10 bacterium RIFCSPLOWO2_12_FULL_66_18]|nr:MAG: 3-phosphoshikimate 1-carboxyvinyltransferase [candidate division NC10 bacterium RIFCSPLOWO2_02_FULL_66_22]OGB96068.1 MAG: 3-phosphoshikimate 1-carboxyvinyltransferase [candidate division NC10 bacterium RIFCSPLOWO2_12_FULL_66_18]